MKSLFIALCFATSIPAFSEDASNMKNHPCAPDIQKFCAGTEKGQGRIMKCLKEHEKELSPACLEKKEASKEKIKAKAKDIVANCKDELKKFCKEVKKGGGAKLKCLEEHKAEASESCKSALP